MDEKGFESINVIPLVDVMLVLLTIVLTTSTFIAMGAIPVQLPMLVLQPKMFWDVFLFLIIFYK